jgi:hypothetical protein
MPREESERRKQNERYEEVERQRRDKRKTRREMMNEYVENFFKKPSTSKKE